MNPGFLACLYEEFLYCQVFKFCFSTLLVSPYFCPSFSSHWHPKHSYCHLHASGPLVPIVAPQCLQQRLLPTTSLFCLEYVSQSPLQLDLSIWLSSRQWNVNRVICCTFWAGSCMWTSMSFPSFYVFPVHSLGGYIFNTEEPVYERIMDPWITTYRKHFPGLLAFKTDWI